MLTVALALGSAASFGASTVAIRAGLRGRRDTAGATLALLASALVVALIAAAIRHDPANAWRFLATGALAPGLSQILYTAAIAEAGAARASAAAGAAPLAALAIAFVALHEPVRIGLILGGVAVVGGGVLLASERARPAHLRARGLVFGLGAAVLFAVRDNLVRALHAHGSPETVAAATLLAGTLVAALAARRAPTTEELRSLAPGGILLAVSYLLLFSAYFHGRVSVVSPLVATESCWSLAGSWLVLGHSEGLGRRMALGVCVIVAGGIAIGISATAP